MIKMSLLVAVIILILFTLWTGWSISETCGRLWPGLIILAGFQSGWIYYSRRREQSGYLFAGLAAIGQGSFLLLFTLMIRLPILGRFEWDRLVEFWPGLVVVGGLAFLGQFGLGRRRDRYALGLGVLLLILGGLAFGFTLGFLSPVWVRRLVSFWPPSLILSGLGPAGAGLLGAGLR